MNAAIPVGCRKFHPSIVPATLFLLGCGLTSAICTLLARHAGYPNWRQQLSAVGILVLVSFALSAVMSTCFPAAFSPEGIYSHSFWGTRSFVRWQNITEVRVFPLIYLPWLRIYADTGEVLWLPLFQRHKREFREEIRKCAPTANPLTKFIESWPA